LGHRKKCDLLALALAGYHHRGEQPIISNQVGIDAISLKQAFGEVKRREIEDSGCSVLSHSMGNGKLIPWINYSRFSYVLAVMGQLEERKYLLRDTVSYCNVDALTTSTVSPRFQGCPEGLSIIAY
jgi:hypothetical protein